MTLYVDSSALLKRYVDEPDSAAAEAFLLGDESWVTARHTVVEVRRNLARLLGGDDLHAAREAFDDDVRRMYIVELDTVTCESAATVAETTGARILDALHVAAALRLGGNNLAFLSFDIRQGQAARQMGLNVLGC